MSNVNEHNQKADMFDTAEGDIKCVDVTGGGRRNQE